MVTEKRIKGTHPVWSPDQHKKKRIRMISLIATVTDRHIEIDHFNTFYISLYIFKQKTFFLYVIYSILNYFFLNLIIVGLN